MTSSRYIIYIARDVDRDILYRRDGEEKAKVETGVSYGLERKIMVKKEKYKTIIAGSRDFTDFELLESAISDYLDYEISEVVCGMARGADMLGRKWAAKNGIPVAEFPAQWDLYGRSAGYKRNEKMASYADRALCFWDGKSRGTKHMIETMEKFRKPVLVVQYWEGHASA